MKNLFIPYEFAVKFKELGFDEKCFMHYEIDEPLTLYQSFGINDYEKNSTLTKYEFSAPLWQQAFDWLLNKTTDEYSFEQVGDSYYIVYEGMDMERRTLVKGSREICLEKLIKIVS